MLITIFTLFSIIGFAQKQKFENPDYKKIEKAIKDSDSNLFYEKLYTRFLDSDSTFTNQEKAHLYYGFIFNESYSPYGKSVYRDSLKTIIKKETLDDADFESIVKYSNLALKENPFDIRTLNYKIYSLNKLEQYEEYNRTITQARTIVDAILYSGDGLTKKTAYYVIFVDHEYDILNILGHQFGGEQKLIDKFDYLKVSPNEQNIKGFYFDISPSLNYLKKMFK